MVRKIDDIDIRASSDCNLERDLGALPHVTGFKLQYIDPLAPFRQRPRSRPRGTQVHKDIDAPTLSFYQTFFKQVAQRSFESIRSYIIRSLARF